MSELSAPRALGPWHGRPRSLPEATASAYRGVKGASVMATSRNFDRSGDAADQAGLLREAIDLQAAGAVGGREVSAGRGYPLEDVEDLLSAE